MALALPVSYRVSPLFRKFLKSHTHAWLLERMLERGTQNLQSETLQGFTSSEMDIHAWHRARGLTDRSARSCSIGLGATVLHVERMLQLSTLIYRGRNPSVFTCGNSVKASVGVETQIVLTHGEIVLRHSTRVYKGRSQNSVNKLCFFNKNNFDIFPLKQNQIC